MTSEFKVSDLQTFTQTLPNPATWICRIIKYELGHSRLFIQATDPSFSDEKDTAGSIVIGFDAVEYFELPMAWTSVDFVVASIDEYIELEYRIRTGTNISEADKRG